MKQYLVLNKRKETSPRELSGIQVVAWMLTPLTAASIPEDDRDTCSLTVAASMRGLRLSSTGLDTNGQFLFGRLLAQFR